MGIKHDEYKLQVEVVKYLRANGWVVISIPNERNLGVADALRMRAAGLTKGAPDLIAFKPADKPYHTAEPWWFELKTEKGKRSREQECMEALADYLCINYKIIRKLEDLPCYKEEGK